MEIDSTTCKALRVQAGLTQAELAIAASVSPKTISDFEKGKTTPQSKTMSAICSALERAGAVLRPGKSRAGGGARWVTAGDLKYWAEADARKLQSVLPELIGRLVRATTPEIETIIDFKSGDSVFMPGWDGQVTAGQGTQYVPQGLTGWEMGCDSGVTAKANSDYNNRKGDPLGLDPISTTFVFVSPRHWKGKTGWIADRRKEGFWADVQALDADDLEQWLVQAPHVAAWLAKEMGKYTAGVEHVHEFWERWRTQTEPPLNASVILAGRTDVRDNKLSDWLQSPGGVLAIQGETEDEALAFLAAALETLKDDPEQSNLQRCLIVHDKGAYRSVAGEPTPMILVVPDSIRELAGAAAKLGHHVFIPLGKDSQVPQQNGLQLPLLNRGEFVKALMEIGHSQEEAEDLSKETGRSLPVLQRRIGFSRNPDWSKPEHAQNLIPALLVGAWDEGNDNDKKILCKLADVTYPELDRTFTQWAKESDAPLRHIGSLWRHTSRLDSWRLLAPHITKSHIEKLADAISEVLGTRDPSFDTPPEDRWSVTDRTPHSGALREGLLQTLILLATKSDDIGFKAAQNPEAWSERQIRKLLDDASEERWHSLSSLLPLISEAAPEAFCQAVDDSLAQTPPPIMKLFESAQPNIGFGGGGSHAGLLWALENLAWDPKFLTRVTFILGTLGRLDPDPDSNYVNRPARSLKEIFILWLTHTYANLNQRLEAINYLIKHEPDAAWKLLLAILPSGSDTSSMTHKMRWRDISAPPPPAVDVKEAALMIILRLLELAKSSGPRCCDLLKKYEYLPYDSRQELIDAIAMLIESGLCPTEREELFDVLRDIISRHRQFPEAKWSMDEEDIVPLANLYEILAPNDPIERHRWLFDNHWVTLMDGTRRNEDEAIKKGRFEALEEILDAHGTDGLIALSEKSKEPGVVGHTIADFLPASEEDWPLLAHWLYAERPVTLAGRSFVSMRERVCGTAWVDTAIDELSLSTDNVAAMFEFFAGLPQNMATWKRLEAQPQEIQEYYWKSPLNLYIRDSAEDVAYAVEKLLMYDRPKGAFKACWFKYQKLPSCLLVNLLDQLSTSSDDEKWRLDGHDIDMAFEALDAATDVSQDDLVRLEWRYAKALNRYGEGRGTKALHRRMANDPSTFVEMLRFVYRHEDENEYRKEKENLDQETGETLASNAYRVLDGMHIIPGTQVDGTIDPKALRKWHQEARDSAGKVGRLTVCDITIGNLFAYAPEEDENIWPAYVVCEAIEEIRSRELERGFSTGVYNKRGVFSKAVYEGGRQEYELASQFRQYARALEGKYPRVAAVLNRIANGYEGDGRREDDDAMARDLSD